MCLLSMLRLDVGALNNGGLCPGVVPSEALYRALAAPILGLGFRGLGFLGFKFRI